MRFFMLNRSEPALGTAVKSGLIQKHEPGAREHSSAKGSAKGAIVLTKFKNPSPSNSWMNMKEVAFTGKGRDAPTALVGAEKGVAARTVRGLSLTLSVGQGENSPKPIARLEPLNHPLTRPSGTLSPHWGRG